MCYKASLTKDKFKIDEVMCREFTVQLEGRPLFAFAGLYTALDEELFSTALITVLANNLFEKIHSKKK